MEPQQVRVAVSDDLEVQLKEIKTAAQMDDKLASACAGYFDLPVDSHGMYFKSLYFWAQCILGKKPGTVI